MNQWFAHVIASIPCTYRSYLPPNLQVLQFFKRHDWIVLGVEFLSEHHATQSPSNELVFGWQSVKAADRIDARINMYFILKSGYLIQNYFKSRLKLNAFACRGMNDGFSDAFQAEPTGPSSP